MVESNTLGRIWAILIIAMLSLASLSSMTSVWADSDDDKADDEKEEVEDGRRSRSSGIAADEATSAALTFLEAKYGEADYKFLKVELDDEKYEVKATDGQRKFEVEIDSVTGDILESKVEALDDDDESAEVTSAIPVTEALAKAEELIAQRFGNRSLTVKEVKLDDGQYKLEIVDNQGGEYEVELNAASGQIIKFEGESEELELEIEHDDEDEIKVEIKEKTDRQREGFKAVLEKKEPKFKLEFETRQNVTESELELELAFDSLLEFLDNGTSTGIFDSNDTTLAKTTFDQLEWSSTRSEKLREDGSVAEITLSQIGAGENISRIALVYHLTASSRLISTTNETEIQANIWQVKFDIHIEGYNWRSAESSLALSGRFNSEFEVEAAKEVKFKTVDGITPFFNWGGDALADGQRIEPTSSMSRNRVTISYPHFNTTLTHDPIMGYLISLLPQPVQVLVPYIMVVGAAAILTIGGIVTITRSRRLRREIPG